MNLEIKHFSRYQYDSSVFVEPQHLYFYPAFRPYVNLRDFEITVDPLPAGLAQRIDAEGNIFYQCWFNDPIDHLNIDVNIIVITQSFNPYDFLVEENPKTDHTEALEVFKPHLQLSKEICAWTDEMRTVTGMNDINFIAMIAREMHEDWNHEMNYNNSLQAPDDTFKSKKGSCRDLSWLLIQMLRANNIPARFVSGYGYNPDLSGHELHAWVEAWIGGAGWIGVDPSSGLLTTEQYVPVATSYHPVNTLPVQGAYRGSSQSKLKTEVKIKVL